ncbi:hypothetical protein [Cohnella luojiensis]|uniref:Uncharacterized protein n=1 Tax=Cohnella luojiensis TaxID=652876 RepID=A0A4Y8LN09_9BACL|nr:hypothetical protein [Cohnella luojiensis]TFE19414.1 hypothetical protein E2980_23345 [Cohnella luojiensis]
MRNLMILICLLCVFGCSDNKKESFYEEATIILDTLEDVIKNKDIYTEKERKKINSFMDKQHPPRSEEIKSKMRAITRYYFAKIKFRNLNDPQNDVLVERQLAELNALRQELLSFKE